MSYFGMTVEDPFYDEDGVMIDEDHEGDWEDVSAIELGIELPAEEYGPYITINS